MCEASDVHSSILYRDMILKVHLHQITNLWLFPYVGGVLTKYGLFLTIIPEIRSDEGFVSTYARFRRNDVPVYTFHLHKGSYFDTQWSCWYQQNIIKWLICCVKAWSLNNLSMIIIQHSCIQITLYRLVGHNLLNQKKSDSLIYKKIHIIIKKEIQLELHTKEAAVLPYYTSLNFCSNYVKIFIKLVSSDSSSSLTKLSNIFQELIWSQI